MALKHMKIHLTFLTITEVKIKTFLIYQAHEY